MMRVGITCYPTYGGSGVVAAELGKELARRGHIVHFISYDLPSRIFELNERIWFHAVEVVSYPLFVYPPYALALASKMAEIAETQDLDLLHVHYAIPHAISAYLAKQIVAPRRLPVITTLHGTDITLVGNDPSYLPITRFGVEKSDSVTAVSEYLRKATYQELNVNKQVQVIPNFVDVELFKRRPSPERLKRYAPRGEKLLIHISNFRPVKRVSDVVRIFARVRKELPAKLLMVGDGPERSKAEHLARNLGLDGDVTFLGKYGQVEELLSIADLLLLPSELESFGLAALEAMACEVPVVATNVGGIPELIANGQIGFLHQVGDVEAMAESALKILSDQQLHEEMRRSCRARAESVYSADKIIPLYEQLYYQVLQQQASA